MTRHDEVKRIFLEACAEADPGRRAVLVAARCGDDDALRREVETLLAHDVAPAVDLERGAADLSAARARTLPAAIGPYRILDLLGEGGMGVVYLAEEPALQRIVALKVLRRALATPALRARFEREVAALARLQHPGIAAIYATGADEEGQPYFAMEYVRGLPLLAWSRVPEATQRRRVALLARIGAAVQHAHDRGVLHRDLKPGNIMVDESGAPRVLDFGVARVAGPDAATRATRTGEVLGTLAYMSPEQIEGRAASQDARTDVYALGVVGFELLSGRLPYDVGGATIAEAARIIRDREPTTLATVARDARGDLETIIGKALEKDPARRYRTVAAFVDDLERFLDGRPILARPPSAGYQLRKLALRHRAVFAAGAVALLALVAAVVVSTTFAIREARARADEARRAAEAQWQAYVANVAAMESALQVPDVVAARRRLAVLREAPSRAAPPFEAAHYAAQLDGSLLVLDIAPRAETEHVTPGEQGRVLFAVAWSPGGRRLAAGAASGEVVVWTVEPGVDRVVIAADPPMRLAAGGGVLGAAFAPDGATLAAVTDDGRLVAWDPASGAERWSVRESDWTADEPAPPNREHGFGSIAWSADGASIAVGTGSGLVRVIDAARGALRARIPIGPAIIWDVAFAGEGEIAAAGSDGLVTIASIAEEAARRQFPAHPPGTTSVAVSPDGTRLATGGADGLLRLWNRRTLGIERVFAGHADRAASVAFAPDGDALLSTSSDFTARLWDLEGGTSIAALIGHEGLVDCGAFAPNGAVIATGSNDGTLRLWDVAALRRGPHVAGHEHRVLALAESVRGLLVTSDSDGGVRVTDAPSGVPIADLPILGPVREIAFDADGGAVAIGRPDGLIELVATDTGTTTTRFTGFASHLGAIRLASDRCVALGFDGVLRAWSRDGAPLWSVAAHEGRGIALAVSPDETLLVTGGFDARARLWSARDGAALGAVEDHAWVVSAAAFVDDAQFLTGSFDGSVRRWTRDGTPVGTAIMHGQPVLAIALDRPGGRFALSFSSPRLAIHDLRSGDLVATLRDVPTVPTRIAWSDGGARVIAAVGPRTAAWGSASLGARADARHAYLQAQRIGEEAARVAIAEANGDLDRAGGIIERSDLTPLQRRTARHAILAAGLSRRAAQ